MPVPDAFLPRHMEDADLARYRDVTSQLAAYAADAKTVDQARQIRGLYSRRPWLSPGVATAYIKWKNSYGQPAARSLARQTMQSAVAPGASRRSVNQDIENLVATKDFQQQVKAFREHNSDGGSLWDSITDALPVVGAVKGIVQGESPGEIALRAVPGAKAAVTIDKAAASGASQIPAVGPAIKGISRAGFTALESPYQELQAGASSVLGHVAGAFTGAAQTSLQGGGGVPSPAPSLLNPAAPTDNGLIVGDQSPFGTSSGAIALKKVIDGEPVDLGTGFLPGGQVEKEHARAVRNIASFQYGGQRHFATPGRIFASTVTEPGTDPFNVLSGGLDALAIIKADPSNIALTKFAEIRDAQKGFRPSEMNEAGGFVSRLRTFVDGPTASQYLDNPRKGGRLLDHLANDFTGPEHFAELMRRTGWKWDLATAMGVIKAKTPEEVRQVLEPALGFGIDRQPALKSFAANIRNTTEQHAMLSEVPSRQIWLTPDRLGGPSGSLRDLYNHALGIGLSDRDISRHLYDIANSSGKVARSEGLINYMNMERAGLVAHGLPDDIARRVTRFASEDLAGRARNYFDAGIARGDSTPGVMINGEMFPLNKPYLIAEHLGDVVTLPALSGKGGRNEALAKFGRVLGIPGTGVGDTTDLNGLEPGWSKAAHTVQHAAWSSNAWLVHVQNSIWKPLALIRGAWMARVLGEEQVRLGMAGHDAMWNHPMSYLAWQTSRHDVPETVDHLDWAQEMGALRSKQAGSFWDRTKHASTSGPSIGSSFGLARDAKDGTAYGRIIAKNTGEWFPDDGVHYAQTWADKLIRYNNDPMMHELAVGLSRPETQAASAVEDLKSRFWNGDLTTFRADLAKDPNFIDHGIDLSKQEGANQYIDGLYDRLHYYTGGDGSLIQSVATGKYQPNITALASGSSLKNLRVSLDGATGEIVEHKAGSKTALMLFDEDHNAQKVPVKDLNLEAGQDATVPILTKTRDNVNVDRSFVNHLHTSDEGIKPPKVSGTVNVRGDTAGADRLVQFMFANMMDRPTSYLNRSSVFSQQYVNEMERLLPYGDAAARTRALDEARSMLLQNGDHPILGHALKDRYARLEAAAKKGVGVGDHTFDELDTIAKARSVDHLRELLYDTHRRTKVFQSLQLLFPFGEAWKEMLTSWGRVMAEKPQTIRRFQVAVTAAHGANPFDYVPGAVPGAYGGRGFLYQDPQNNGADTFVYPWSGALNEQMLGVNVPFTGEAQSLSMGLQLIPGVGPAFQMPAMYALDHLIDDPKWDPVKRLIAPYGAADPSEGGILEQTFTPAWMKKWLTGMFANPEGQDHSGKALNNMISDVMAYRASTGEADMNSPEGIRKAYKDAVPTARMLYMMQGTFQFGAPAAPHAEFLANDKHGNLVRFSILRDALHKMYADPKIGPDKAVHTFIDRFGERAFYATAPKTLGTVFGAQYTQQGLDWQRTHKDLVNDYPLSYGEMIPSAPKDAKQSYDAYLRATQTGERKGLSAKTEITQRVNNVLGSMWYDQVRQKLGLKFGEAGTKQEQAYLRDVRNKIHQGYPGWRQVPTDSSRVPRVVEELVGASSDARVKASNPLLFASLGAYVRKRQEVIDAVKADGGGGDFSRPGFATAQRYAPYREYLRQVAEALGKHDPQFQTLFDDTFAREMSQD